MAGSFRSSRIIVLAFAAAALVATASTYVVDRVVHCWRRARAEVASWLFNLVTVRMPRLCAEWLRPEVAVRVKKDGMLGMRAVLKRRPLISTRWRFAPSV